VARFGYDGVHLKDDFGAAGMTSGMRRRADPYRGGVFRSLTSRQLAFDLVVPAAMLLVLLTAYGLGEPGDMLVVFGMAIALAFRRLSPGLALALAWVVAVVQMALQLQPNPSNLAIGGVLYATAAYGSKLVRWTGFISAPVGALLAAIYVLVLPRLTSFGAFQAGLQGGFAVFLVPTFQLWIAGTTFFLLSWTLGLLARTWMRARDSRRAQAEAERVVVVEQERNRIARDMHDVVAHSLAVVIAQADGARYAQRADPAAAEAALGAIAATAREALADVRVLLAQLRHSEGEGPQPVLADLDRLYAQLRDSGLRIEHSESGSPAPLSTATQLAVYRVVQEALTNALRHGDPVAPVSVRFSWADRELRIEVRNRLRPDGPPQGAPGHGLTGMTERALLAGGRLTAEAVSGEFVVDAVLPAPAGVVPGPTLAENAR
jgi:signal transduction histidine kinase